MTQLCSDVPSSLCTDLTSIYKICKRLIPFHFKIIPNVRRGGIELDMVDWFGAPIQRANPFNYFLWNCLLDLMIIILEGLWAVFKLNSIYRDQISRCGKWLGPGCTSCVAISLSRTPSQFMEIVTFVLQFSGEEND